MLTLDVFVSLLQKLHDDEYTYTGDIIVIVALVHGCSVRNPSYLICCSQSLCVTRLYRSLGPVRRILVI